MISNDLATKIIYYTNKIILGLNHPGAVTKSSVGLVVLCKARVSKSKQTDGGSLLKT